MTGCHGFCEEDEDRIGLPVSPQLLGHLGQTTCVSTRGSGVWQPRELDHLFLWVFWVEHMTRVTSGIRLSSHSVPTDRLLEPSDCPLENCFGAVWTFNPSSRHNLEIKDYIQMNDQQVMASSLGSSMPVGRIKVRH